MSGYRSKRRKKLEAAVWKGKHRDYKSIIGGDRYVLVNRGGQGTVLAPLSSLTTSELFMMAHGRTGAEMHRRKRTLTRWRR